MIAIIEITQQCNLSCSHCGIGSRGDDLPLPELLQGMVTLKERFDDFRFVGGEPLLAPDRLEAAIELVSSWHMPSSITTNGLLVRTLKDRIKRWNLRSVCLSIDGAEQSHDSQRGKKGAYRSVCEAGYLLSEMGIRVQVSMCLTRINYRDVEAVYRFCEEVGAEFFRIQPMVPLLDINQKILLSPGELHEILDICAGIKGKIEMLVPRNLCLLPNTEQCVAGKMWIYVCSDGVVMPCIYAPLPVGYLGRDSADVLIERSQFLSPAQGCCDCDHVLSCRGGCRGAALGQYKDINAPDPNCLIAITKGYYEQYLANQPVMIKG